MSIGKLKNLKNLQLYQCLFNISIANEIGDLLNLETLSIFSNSMLPKSLLCTHEMSAAANKNKNKTLAFISIY